jgi:hypothetical protein
MGNVTYNVGGFVRSEKAHHDALRFVNVFKTLFYALILDKRIRRIIHG